MGVAGVTGVVGVVGAEEVIRERESLGILSSCFWGEENASSVMVVVVVLLKVV